MRRCVSFMLLFCDSLDIDTTAADYREAVLEQGAELEKKIAAFFVARGISASSTGTAERQLRALHKAGALDGLIIDFQARVAAGVIVDPTPRRERAVLAPVSQ